MWTLARLLPLMIGSKIPEGNAYWLHFIELTEILDYALCPIVRQGIPDYLTTVISNNLRDFQQLHPDSSFLPKMHYITHIPRYLKKYVNSN